jgi:hypothetical protein
MLMYTRDGKKGQNAVSYAELKFLELKAQFPTLREFMDYFEK